jgi:hypothetical protein
MAKSKLPFQVFVTKTVDGKASWLYASDTTELMEEGSEVGIYELVDTKKLVVSRELV